MAIIPEMVLRRMVVAGSLSLSGSGFKFDLRNNLAPATVAAFRLTVGENEIAQERIYLSLAGQAGLYASQITAETPFQLPMNVLVTVQVEEMPQYPDRLRINVVTREAGSLQFHIGGGLSKVKSGRTNFWRRLAWRLRYQRRAAKVRKDPQHPHFHFAAPANWMNDPNGLIQWKGKYHIFYQHNPDAAEWGNMHWGHAVSPDLVHWQHLPIAMAPTPGGPDEGGCFSGCAVEYQGKPVFIYTAVFPETQCLAFGLDDLRKWKKYKGNPVISSPPEGMQVEGFRDPYVWRDQDGWHMVLGSGIRGVGGTILYYRSKDLLNWQYIGPILTGDLTRTTPFPTGSMWECPQFFKLGNSWYLILSLMGAGAFGVAYYRGDFVDGHFSPYSLSILDYGGRFFYAPQTFVDQSGRRVMVGWLLEERSPAAQLHAGWSGVHSIPRLLSEDAHGQLCIQPVPELASLRHANYHKDQVFLGELECLPEGAPSGPQLEITCSLFSGDAAEVGFVLLGGAQQETSTRIYVDSPRSMLVVDTTCSSGNADAPGRVAECPLVILPGHELRLHIFIDRSVIEVFANSSTVLTARFYPPDPESLHLGLYARGSGAALNDFDVWSLKDSNR